MDVSLITDAANWAEATDAIFSVAGSVAIIVVAMVGAAKVLRFIANNSNSYL